MKPGDRIKQIHREKLEKYAGVELPTEKYAAIDCDAIVQYLNEQWEAEQESIEKLKRDLKPM